MRQKIFTTSAALLLALGLNGNASAATLELALVIDGSSSIAASEWDLQIGAYQSVFEDDFYTTYVEPSPFDTVYVAAYFFSGGFTYSIGGPDIEVGVFSVLDWAPITDNGTAAAFGAQFAGIPQPNATTATAEALNVAASGGMAGCPGLFDRCNLERQNVVGIDNNGIDSDWQVIDISTDGDPTEPNGNGTPNPADDALAIAAADNARALGITVNALGVRSFGQQGPDLAFLNELVGANPVKSPEGFVLTADSFEDFEATLRDKLVAEIIPVPAALPLFLSALAGLGLWRRRAVA